MSNMKEYRMSFSKAGCFTTQVIRLPLANLVGKSLYWLTIVAVSFGKEVVVDSISPRSIRISQITSITNASLTYSHIGSMKLLESKRNGFAVQK